MCKTLTEGHTLKSSQMLSNLFKLFGDINFDRF